MKMYNMIICQGIEARELRQKLTEKEVEKRLEKFGALSGIMQDVEYLEKHIKWIHKAIDRAERAKMNGNMDYAEFVWGQIAKVASEYNLGSKTDREKLTYTGDHAVDYIAGRVKNYGHRKP